MPPAGFEPAISASERSQTDALDRAATGTSPHSVRTVNICRVICSVCSLDRGAKYTFQLVSYSKSHSKHFHSAQMKMRVLFTQCTVIEMQTVVERGGGAGKGTLGVLPTFWN